MKRPQIAEEPELFGTVLAAVSRSFYLTIRVLPRAVRRPVGLAYLLARTSDTLADGPGVSSGVRLEALRQFAGGIRGCSQPMPMQAGESSPGAGLHPPGVPDVMEKIGLGIADPAERALLTHTGTLLQLLRCTDPADRAEVIRVLNIIIGGQELDIQRFCGPEQGMETAPDPKSGGPIRTLANAGELDDYTFRVAGCVGEFWTRICNRHLRHYSRREAEDTIRLGIAFGKGLQLVNILRDAPADLANGRCYLPGDELEALGIAPETLRTDPAAARPVFKRWIARARESLDAGCDYLEAVRPYRLRLACFLPWAIGVKTLALLEQTPSLESAQRVKVSRKEIRRLLGWGIAVGASNAALRRFRASILKK